MAFPRCRPNIIFLAILIAAELTILEIFNSQEIFAIHTNVAIFFLYLGLLTSKPARVQVACGGQNHPPRKRCDVDSRIVKISNRNHDETMIQLAISGVINDKIQLRKMGGIVTDEDFDVKMVETK